MDHSWRYFQKEEPQLPLAPTPDMEKDFNRLQIGLNKRFSKNNVFKTEYIFLGILISNLMGHWKLRPVFLRSVLFIE